MATWVRCQDEPLSAWTVWSAAGEASLWIAGWMIGVEAAVVAVDCAAGWEIAIASSVVAANEGVAAVTAAPLLVSVAGAGVVLVVAVVVLGAAATVWLADPIPPGFQ